MASRAERLLELMQCLRRRTYPVRGADLAAELGVSLRTVYRDIAALQAQGAVIDGEAGVGYVLRPGFTLPPLMFSEEELEAIALGTRWVAQRAGSSLGRAAHDAFARIAAVLPPDLRCKLEGSTLLVGPVDGAAFDEADFARIRTAIRAERKLHIRYRDEKGAETDRVIWPFAVGFFERVHLVVAWCERRQAFRSFRADRVLEVTPLEDRTPRRRAALLQDWRQAEGISQHDSG